MCTLWRCGAACARYPPAARPHRTGLARMRNRCFPGGGVCRMWLARVCALCVCTVCIVCTVCASARTHRAPRVRSARSVRLVRAACQQAWLKRQTCWLACVRGAVCARCGAAARSVCTVCAECVHARSHVCLPIAHDLVEPMTLPRWWCAVVVHCFRCPVTAVQISPTKTLVSR